jgi:hypothetical protein
MSPTYTMSAHLCKQIYSSWRQTHPEPASHQSQSSGLTPSYYSQRSPSPEPKRSMDSDRSDTSPPPPLSRQSKPNLKWNWS